MPDIDIEPALTIIEKENTYKGSLIGILQKIQTDYGYLHKDILNIIARRLDIPVAKIIGVSSFYSQFRFEPIGKYVIKVCDGTACHISGGTKLSDVLKENLGIQEGETTKDKLFTLERVACLGCCSLAPVIMVEDTAYGRLTPNKIKKIINNYRKRG